MPHAAYGMTTILPSRVAGKMIDGHQLIGSRQELMLSYEQPPRLGSCSVI